VNGIEGSHRLIRESFFGAPRDFFTGQRSGPR
jgi:hypothetical protein